MCGRAATHGCGRTPNAGFETSRVDRAVSVRKSENGAENHQRKCGAEIVFHAARKQLGESSLCSDPQYMAGCHGVFKANRPAARFDLNRGCTGNQPAAVVKSLIGR